MTKANGEKKLHYGMIMTVYLFGIFMGALDTGIVTPARTIIQNHLNVDDKTGIWMITIYTLAYAASIPIMGKLADRFGRKKIYIVSILLFGLGSLLCGLSQEFGSFGFLLAARVVQAIGGGGIMPVATAEFGTIFPKEKQGMALGLVGGVYGVANIFGSSAGSAILDLFGKNNWQFIFYVNVPISLFVIIAGLIFLPDTKAKSVKKIDILGIFLLVVMVLSLLYGLKNIDFFHFTQTIRETDVFPFLLVFLVLIPVFIFVEKKAEDPAMNLRYFRNLRIVVTLIVAVISGILLMGMVFVPQFSENAMRIPSGDGGYFVIMLGIFAGVGAPVSGKLIDKIGAKPVLMGGFFLSIVGSLFLMLIAIPYPSYPTILIALMLTGLGIGFTMGAPLNYMMLSNTDKEESATALATLSLVRSIGTTVAPAIMVAFLAHAGSGLQTQTMSLLPKEVSVPPLPYSQKLNQEFTKLESDPNYKDKLANVSLPDLTTMTKVKINTSGSSVKVPADVLELLKTSDVTNITARTKIFASRMFDLTTPSVIRKIQSGVQSGIDSIQNSRSDLTNQISKMNTAVSGIDKGIAQMKQAAAGIQSGLNGVSQALGQQKQALAGMNSLYAQMAAASSSAHPSGFSGTAPGGTTSGATVSGGTTPSILSMLPPFVLNQIPKSVVEQLKDVKTPAQLKAKIDSLQAVIQTMTQKKAQLEAQESQLITSIGQAEQKKASLLSAVNGMKSGLREMETTVSEMQTLKNAVPSAFREGQQNYLAEIQKRSAKIESNYQATLNTGFWQIYLTTSIFALIAFLLLFFYREKRNLPQPTDQKQV